MKEAVFLSYERTRDWIPNQCGNTDYSKQRAVSDPNLLNVTELGYQCRSHRDESAGAETVECCERDDGGVGLGWYPQGEYQDGGHVGCDDHNVEPANLVCEVARNCTAEDTGEGELVMKGLPEGLAVITWPHSEWE